MKNPLLSVIIPVYNIEPYLAASIESIINQSLDFKSQIELILVDDSSTDSSADVCKNFSKKYPENIIFIKQEKSGVSAARDRGLKQARGKYINFFDGDDLLSKSFYKESVEFLARNKDVNFVASKIKFFDEIIDSHPLNYKFTNDRVIDLDKDPDSPILHAVSCVFRRSCLAGITFNEQLTIAEDVKFLSDILLAKRRYGVIKKPTYYYRKRSSGGSAIGGKEQNKDYYLITPHLAYQAMLADWRASGDSLAIEHTLLYDLSYRLQQKSQSVLVGTELIAYKKTINNLLADCSDKAICNSRFLSIHQKLYALTCKHKESIEGYLAVKGHELYFKDFPLFDYSMARVGLDFITKIHDHTYKLEGYTDLPEAGEIIHVNAAASGKSRRIKPVARAQHQESFLGTNYFNGGAFEVEVNLEAGTNLSFNLDGDAGQPISVPIDTGQFTRLGPLKFTYRRDDDLLLKKDKGLIKVMEYDIYQHLRLEMRMWLQILLNWRLRGAYQQLQKLRSRSLAQLNPKAKIFEALKPLLIVAEAVVTIPRALLIRSLYFVTIRSKKRPIWIISDRGMAAGDNGEALFRYIVRQKDCPADVYFAISKKSRDYSRMAKIGNVLDQNSLKYKLKFLLADKIISSQADIETTNPFLRQRAHYEDLFTFDYVFLQHGIIRHNLSTWLNRFDRNIKLFITSADREYKSIFSNPYYYAPENVLLSGLPRYDYLESKPNRKLILAPTYRKNLAAKQATNRNGARHYDANFKHSEYRNFYNNFMNDSRITSALVDAEMTGEFYLHPSFAAQHSDFDENENFKAMHFPYDYKTAFREGELLVSDHSSVVFDFAYLKKPVTYAHFDVDTFFQNHSYDRSNFFSDTDDGFGPVYYDYDSLVEGVVEQIKAGCKMPPKYQNRVDKFFYKVDKHNSERVYRAIIRSR